MSLGILTLKISLVAGVTGVSIATPILLNKKGANSPEVVTQTDSVQSSSLGVGERTEERTDLGSRDSESLPREQTSRTDDSRSQAISTPSQLTSANFDKTCFEVPATSDSDENMQLLTCFDTENAKNAHLEQDPEFDSLFHLYNKSTKDNPVNVSEKMEWSVEESKITVNLTGASSQTTKYSFSVDDQLKNSLEKSTNLKNECTIFGVTARDSGDVKEYWLACGDDTSDFEKDSPKGIKLTSWTKQ